MLVISPLSDVKRKIEVPGTALVGSVRNLSSMLLETTCLGNFLPAKNTSTAEFQLHEFFSIPALVARRLFTFLGTGCPWSLPLWLNSSRMNSPLLSTGCAPAVYLFGHWLPAEFTSMAESQPYEFSFVEHRLLAVLPQS